MNMNEEYKKIVAMKSNLKRWKNNETFSPYNIELHMVSKCNTKCKYCDGRPWFYNKREMNFGSFLKIVKQCIDLGVQEFRFSGPEPTIRKNELITLLKIIGKHKRTSSISTNASLLEKEDLKKIVKIKGIKMYISFDSHIPSIHNFLRSSKSAFNNVMRTLSIIKRLKLKNNLNYPQIILVSVITNMNYNKILDFIEFVKEYQIRHIIFQPLIIQTTYATKLKLNRYQLKSFISKIDSIQKLLKKYGIDSNIHDLRNKKYFEKSTNSFGLMLDDSNNNQDLMFNVPCFDPWWSISILHNGYIGPCINLAEKNKISLKNHSIKEIWYGNFFNDLRSKIFNKNYPQACAQCKVCANKIVELEKGRLIQLKTKL